MAGLQLLPRRPLLLRIGRNSLKDFWKPQTPEALSKDTWRKSRADAKIIWYRHLVLMPTGVRGCHSSKWQLLSFTLNAFPHHQL